MSLVPEQAEFLRDVCKLIAYATDHGFVVTGGELERKPEMQKIYVQIGRSKTMDSMHLQRCAIDLNFFRLENDKLELTYDVAELSEVGAYWESLNPRNRWGGNWNSFKDVPHFERNLKSVRPATVTVSTGDSGLQPASVPQGFVSPQAATPDNAQEAPAFGQVLKAGSGNVRAVALLQTLLSRVGALANIDGSFGEGTERAIRQYQNKAGLKVDGVVGEKTWTALIAAAPDVFTEISSRWIGEKDFDDMAERLKCNGAAVRAVYEVESGGAGFLGLKPTVLFEGHVFWGRLKKHGIDPASVKAGNEDIVYPTQTYAYYKRGMAEWGRLERAIGIHRQAALESASWGLFQIMGYHWESLGYQDIEQFVEAMCRHEREHLSAFGAFLERNHRGGKALVEYLRNQQWTLFAEGYNGEGYRKNRYDEKLAAAYARHV